MFDVVFNKPNFFRSTWAYYFLHINGMLFAALLLGHMAYCYWKMFKWEINFGSFNTYLTLLNLNLFLSYLTLLLTFAITRLIHCVKHLIGIPFLLHQSEENFVRRFFIPVLRFEKLIQTGSLYLGPLQFPEFFVLDNKYVSSCNLPIVWICKWWCCAITKQVVHIV